MLPSSEGSFNKICWKRGMEEEKEKIYQIHEFFINKT